jgi:hypothetical protein
VKVNVVDPLLPSALFTLLMLIRGSLSRIVPMPWSSAMSAFVGLLRLTVKLSAGSAMRSPRTATVNVRLVCPAGDGDRPGPRRVVASGDRGDVRGVVLGRHVNGGRL